MHGMHAATTRPAASSISRTMAAIKVLRGPAAGAWTARPRLWRSRTPEDGPRREAPDFEPVLWQRPHPSLRRAAMVNRSRYIFTMGTHCRDVVVVRACLSGPVPARAGVDAGTDPRLDRTAMWRGAAASGSHAVHPGPAAVPLSAGCAPRQSGCAPAPRSEHSGFVPTARHRPIRGGAPPVPPPRGGGPAPRSRGEEEPATAVSGSDDQRRRHICMPQVRRWAGHGTGAAGSANHR